VALTGCAAHATVAETPKTVERPGIDRLLRRQSEVDMSGWLSFQGEIVIYDSLPALDLDLVYPYCVSGLLAPDLNIPAKRLDRKKVSVHAQRFEYTSLQDEPGAMPTRKLLKGRIIANGCQGRYVLYITKISTEK